MMRLLFQMLSSFVLGFILLFGSLMYGLSWVKFGMAFFVTFLILLLIEDVLAWRRNKRMKEMERRLHRVYRRPGPHSGRWGSPAGG